MATFLSKLVRVSLLPLVVLLTTPAMSQERPSVAPADDTTQAREHFKRGIAQVRAAEWARALDSFRQSALLKAHAVTSYNIGACLRAMGRYTAARRSFMDALVRNASTPGELPKALTKDSSRYLKEIDKLLVRARVTVAPADALIAVDGAPLVREGDNLMVAGVRDAGPGAKVPLTKFTLLLDPGAHVVIMNRKGYDQAALNVTYKPGDKPALDLSMDRLPATLHIAANTDGAIVKLDGRSVGFVPLELQRPAGAYRVAVEHDGYTPYASSVRVKPGEEVTLRANLVEEEPSVLETWWFWTAAGVVITGAVVGTYFATRPEAERPPLNGGGLGWVVPIP
jgi:hypothetical protein